MHHFNRRNGELYVEDVRVADLARKHGTPLYIYSGQTIIDHYERLSEAFAPIDHMVCYALKANGNLGILKMLAKRGCGFDLVSGGELFRVRKAGGPAKRCVFAGVGKTEAEIEQGLREGIYSFNVESEAELEFINKVAGRMKKTAPIAIRVNPNVDSGVHAKTNTGTYENKFGIAFEKVEALYAKAARLYNLRLVGVQMHIGSGLTSLRPFIATVKKMLPLVMRLKAAYNIEFFDIGGGVGIVYGHALESGPRKWWKKKHAPLTIAAYAAALIPLLKDLGLKILLEPGRVIVGNAGVLVTEVLYVKKTGRKTFVIVDAGMNDLIRPTLYESYHEVVPVKQPGKQSRLVSTDLVGPVCESGDYFCKDRPLPPFKQGDLVALLSTGAYGFAMASNYNARPRPPEILVQGKRGVVARKRETMADLIRGEV